MSEGRSEEHTSELQSQSNLVCRLLLEKKKKYMKRQSIFFRNRLLVGTQRGSLSTSASFIDVGATTLVLESILAIDMSTAVSEPLHPNAYQAGSVRQVDCNWTLVLAACHNRECSIEMVDDDSLLPHFAPHTPLHYYGHRPATHHFFFFF